MPNGNASSYGLWSLVIINSLVFILFAFSFSGTLAQTGAYARIQHPQYVAFVLIMFGLLLQWPTVLTLVMFPVLVLMYARLAINEEAEMRAQHGVAYANYAARTPRFIPALGAGRRRSVP
jgi:protein-S-isoprenylcysteine O-methyltransferase Ste14